MVIGGLDWFARYQTVKDIVAVIAGHGVATLISYPWLSPALIVVGFALLLGNRRRSGTMDDAGESKPPTSNTLNASPTIEQHVHIGENKKAEIPPVPKKVGPVSKPNLSYVGHRTTNLRQGIRGTGFYEDEIEQNDNSVGILVCFKNRHYSDENWKTGYVDDVRACISFYEDGDSEIGEGVSDGCWLGDLRRIEFSVEDSNCVVALLAKRDSKQLLCPYLRQTRSEWGMGITVEGYKIPNTPKTIKISLFSGSELLACSKFGLSFEGKMLPFRVPSYPALRFLWRRVRLG